MHINHFGLSPNKRMDTHGCGIRYFRKNMTTMQCTPVFVDFSIHFLIKPLA